MAANETATRSAPVLRGLDLAARRWPVLLVLWLAALLTALPFTVLPGEALLSLMYRPALADMATGLEAWNWLDLASALRIGQSIPGGPPGEASGTIPDDIQQGIVGVGLVLALMPALGGLASALVYGGALLSYRERDLPFSARRFAWGCWHWFGGFSLLALVQFLATVALLLPILFFGGGLALGMGGWGWLVWLPLAALAAFWLAVFEQARVFAVARDQRNPFAGLGAAFASLLRSPQHWLPVYALSLLALAGLHFVFRLGLLPALAGEWPLLLLAQQGFILARLFLRAARLAGGMEIARGT